MPCLCGFGGAGRDGAVGKWIPPYSSRYGGATTKREPGKCQMTEPLVAPEPVARGLATQGSQIN